MIDILNCKFWPMLDPIDATGATDTGVIEVDMRGWDWLLALVYTGNVAANMTVLKLAAATTTGGSLTDITSAAFTLPLATGGDSLLQGVYLPFTGAATREPFVKLVYTAGAGATLIAALGITGRGRLSPTSTSEMGLDYLVKLS